MMKKSQEFLVYVSRLPPLGPRIESVDLKYNALCLEMFVYGIPA